MNTPSDIYDIYGYYYVPFWSSKFFIYSIIVALLLIVFIIIFFIWRKYKIKNQLKSWEIALSNLHKIDLKRFSSKKDYKIFYIQLTSIIKKYLSKRYSWHLLDKTDDEMIKFLVKQSFDVKLLNDLKNLIQDALIVKFANESALKTQAEKDLKITFELVENTKDVTG